MIRQNTLWATCRWYGLTLCDPRFQCAQGDKKTKRFVSNSRVMSWSDTLWSMFSSMWLNSGVSTCSCWDFFSLQSHRYENSGCWAAICIKSFFFCLPLHQHLSKNIGDEVASAISSSGVQSHLGNHSPTRGNQPLWVIKTVRLTQIHSQTCPALLIFEWKKCGAWAFWTFFSTAKVDLFLKGRNYDKCILNVNVLRYTHTHMKGHTSKHVLDRYEAETLVYELIRI